LATGTTVVQERGLLPKTEGDPMTQLTEEQMAAFSRQLEARQAQLASEVRLLNDEAGEASAPSDLSNTAGPVDPGDEGDRGERATRTAVRHAEKERDQQELQEISEARERMQAGDYGQCVECGTGIAPERLQAMPSAARCIACQDRHERDHSTGMRIR
jgi:RNA polymerase-binding transcription factor DksA